MWYVGRLGCACMELCMLKHHGICIACSLSKAKSCTCIAPQSLSCRLLRHAVCCQVLSVWYSKFCCDSEAQQRVALNTHCQPGMLFEDNFIKVRELSWRAGYVLFPRTGCLSSRAVWCTWGAGGWQTMSHMSQRLWAIRHEEWASQLPGAGQLQHQAGPWLPTAVHFFPITHMQSGTPSTPDALSTPCAVGNVSCPHIWAACQLGHWVTLPYLDTMLHVCSAGVRSGSGGRPVLRPEACAAWHGAGP